SWLRCVFATRPIDHLCADDIDRFDIDERRHGRGDALASRDRAFSRSSPQGAGTLTWLFCSTPDASRITDPVWRRQTQEIQAQRSMSTVRISAGSVSGLGPATSEREYEHDPEILRRSLEFSGRGEGAPECAIDALHHAQRFM